MNVSMGHTENLAKNASIRGHKMLKSSSGARETGMPKKACHNIIKYRSQNWIKSQSNHKIGLNHKVVSQNWIESQSGIEPQN